ncbi:hypothetical protein A9Q91_05280 [Candidatus Gracilibacteria bacterium 28_42_T64]|nr:hypothetical protein A9Q91_05280 [Candidatus Gracilibacteria bacterium 28_42_T64]
MVEFKNKEDFEVFLDYFAYYHGYKGYLKGREKFQRPYFYFKNIDTRQDLDIGFSECRESILGYDKRYIFLFLNESILDPCFMSQKQGENVDELLKENKYNFYALAAYVRYYDNKGSREMNEIFRQLLECNTDNPYVLCAYSRFLGTRLYRMHKDKKYLSAAKKYCIKAVKILEKRYTHSEIPTFIYSRLGYIYLALGDQKKAISLFNGSIILNETYYKYRQPEPFIGKAAALKKIGKYDESQDILMTILHDAEINNKNDFKFYKTLAENNLILGDYENFYIYLKQSVQKFFNEFSELNFHENMQILSLESNLKSDVLFSNSKKDFLNYYGKYINDETDEIMFSLAFLYREHHIGESKAFQGLMNIEKLCYNYLLYIDEGKVR